MSKADVHAVAQDALTRWLNAPVHGWAKPKWTECPYSVDGYHFVPLPRTCCLLCNAPMEKP